MENHNHTANNVNPLTAQPNFFTTYSGVTKVYSQYEKNLTNFQGSRLGKKLVRVFPYLIFDPNVHVIIKHTCDTPSENPFHELQEYYVLILQGVTANFVHQGTMKNLQDVTILVAHYLETNKLGT